MKEQLPADIRLYGDKPESGIPVAGKNKLDDPLAKSAYPVIKNQRMPVRHCRKLLYRLLLHPISHAVTVHSFHAAVTAWL